VIGQERVVHRALSGSVSGDVEGGKKRKKGKREKNSTFLSISVCAVAAA
jgi:hypothetical protein